MKAQADYPENIKGETKDYTFYTFYVGYYGNDVAEEEIDVLALSEYAAEEFVKSVLVTDFAPGMTIMNVVKRPKNWLTF